MIRLTTEWLIDSIVVTFLVIIGMFIIGIAFFLYPFKKIRNFCGKKVIHLMDTADYFLGR